MRGRTRTLLEASAHLEAPPAEPEVGFSAPPRNPRPGPPGWLVAVDVLLQRPEQLGVALRDRHRLGSDAQLGLLHGAAHSSWKPSPRAAS
jgi:hypothetical protein